MYSKRRVFLAILPLLGLLRGVCANEWKLESRERQLQRYWNNTQTLIPRIYTHVNPSRTSNSPPTVSPESLFQAHSLLATLICVVVTLMIICTLIGNAMVCLAVCLVRKLKQQPANLLLVSLAVADFWVGLLVMPIALITIIHNEWLLGNAVCVLWTTADLMLCTASIMNLCLISVDRYLAVTQPLTYIGKRTVKRILVYIFIVWICALLVSTTPLIVFPISRSEKLCQVSQNQLYQIYATVLSFYAPCVIMIILFWRMWKAAKILQQRDQIANKWSLTQSDETDHGNDHSSTKRLSPHLHPTKNALSNGNTCSTNNLLENSPRRLMHRPSSILHAIRVPLIHLNSKNHEKTEDKARKTLGVIMTVFVVCWLPFFILALLKSLDIIKAPHWLDLLVLWLGYSNSMLNPLLYCKYNREFRIPFREMLCCRFSTLQTVMRNESFVTKFGPPRMKELRNSTATAAAVLAIPGLDTGQSAKFSMESENAFSNKLNGSYKSENLDSKTHIASV